MESEFLGYRDVRSRVQDDLEVEEEFARELVELLEAGQYETDQNSTEFYINELEDPDREIREAVLNQFSESFEPEEVLRRMDAVYRRNEERVDYRSRIDSLAAEAYQSILEPDLDHSPEVSQSSP